jgi:hypothetical protein
MSAATHCQKFAGDYLKPNCSAYKQALAVCPVDYYQVAMSLLRKLESSDCCCCCSRLLALHRTSVLRHDEYGQETLVNLLLRNYLHYNLYDQVRMPHLNCVRLHRPFSCFSSLQLSAELVIVQAVASVAYAS